MRRGTIESFHLSPRLAFPWVDDVTTGGRDARGSRVWQQTLAVAEGRFHAPPGVTVRLGLPCAFAQPPAGPDLARVRGAWSAL